MGEQRRVQTATEQATLLFCLAGCLGMVSEALQGSGSMRGASVVVLDMLLPDGSGLQVRVGIHTGRVVVGTVGNEGRHEALALGETPNIAARVQALAQPSTVVVTDSTRQLLGEQFRCVEIGRHDLRGFRQSMRLHQVLSEDAVSSTDAEAAPRILVSVPSRSIGPRPGGA